MVVMVRVGHTRLYSAMPGWCLNYHISSFLGSYQLIAGFQFVACFPSLSLALPPFHEAKANRVALTLERRRNAAVLAAQH